jgi:hypothetical protein
VTRNREARGALHIYLSLRIRNIRWAAKPNVVAPAGFNAGTLDLDVDAVQEGAGGCGAPCQVRMVAADQGKGSCVLKAGSAMGKTPFPAHGPSEPLGFVSCVPTRGAPSSSVPGAGAWHARLAHIGLGTIACLPAILTQWDGGYSRVRAPLSYDLIRAVAIGDSMDLGSAKVDMLRPVLYNGVH